MILTKEYRLVWDSEIILYGQFETNTKTETNKDAYHCDTRTELETKATSLGFSVPEDDMPGIESQPPA